MDNKTRRTPAEVAAQASVEHTGKGILNELKGNLKEAWGKVTDNPKMTFGGKVDKVKGRVQQGIGKLEAKESRLESGTTDFDETDRT